MPSLAVRGASALKSGVTDAGSPWSSDAAALNWNIAPVGTSCCIDAGTLRNR